jgi:hypothetical protein
LSDQDIEAKVRELARHGAFSGRIDDVIAAAWDPSSTAPFCKLLKVPDNSRRDGSVALHVLERQSVCGDRLHCWWQRHAGGTQCEAGSDPGR